jgi:2,3-bisphosphoglycerate-independent phosphoglycerate mutase
MRDSQRELPDHPVNRARVSKGERPANSLWFWGQGTKPTLPPFGERFGIGWGAVISAVDLIQGLGVLMDLSIIKVEGATGWIDTNYAGKVEAALNALSSGADIVYLHVEAPDEAGHEGDALLKVRAIEEFDRNIVGPVLAGLKKFDKYRVLLMPDHRTPVRLKTHDTDPVPFSFFGDGFSSNGADSFSESSCGNTGLFVENGHALMGRLFG